MKVIKYLSIVALAVCVASCGGKKNDEVSSENEEIEVVETSDDTELSSSDEDVTMSDIPEVSTENVSTENEETTEVATSSSENWDAFLDTYEKYVDQYISYAKKAAKGDMSALAEYTGLMQKTQELSDKMENAKDEMTAAQWARYSKIVTKMSKAAMEMQAN